MIDMGWRLAYSLDTLRAQVNKAYPDRDKTSDGTIGDAAHSKTASDHNPNSKGVVCALDLDHDPDNGFDGDRFLAAQLKNPHPNLKYIVWEGHIYSRKYGWKKRKSSGHYNHMHISVGVGQDGKSLPGTYDDTTNWDIGIGSNSGSTKPEGSSEVHKVKATEIEYAEVKIPTGDNGAGAWDIQLSRDGMKMIGYGFEGISSQGLFVTLAKRLGNGRYKIGVSGAPGAHTITVIVAFA